MDKPYIICHMLTSLDGKIIGDYLCEERAAYFIDEYEKIHDRYGCKAWMCGRITMDEMPFVICYDEVLTRSY